MARPPNWERESLLWESPRHSNLSVDYQIYLDAFPNGLFAPMAKNRIALLGSAPTTKRAPEAAPPTGPAGPPEKELKAEIGTYDTEKYLRLEAVDRKEIQARLQVLRYYTGPIDGSFNEQTRQAIAEWQKKRQVAPTGMLGPVEIAALQVESEEMYQAYLKGRPRSRMRSPRTRRPRQSPRLHAIGPGSGYGSPLPILPPILPLPLPPLRLPLPPAQAPVLRLAKTPMMGGYSRYSAILAYRVPRGSLTANSHGFQIDRAVEAGAQRDSQKTRNDPKLKRAAANRCFINQPS